MPADAHSKAADGRRYGVRRNGELVWEGGCRKCADSIAHEIRSSDPAAKVMVVARG